MSRSFLLVAVLVIIAVMITSSSSAGRGGGVLAQSNPPAYPPRSFSCNSADSTTVLTVPAGTYPYGITVTDTNRPGGKSCQVEIGHVTTQYITFANDVIGNESFVYIHNNVFLGFPNNGTRIIPKVKGFTAAIAFEGNVGDIGGRVHIESNTWKQTDSTYLDDGLMFVHFAASVSKIPIGTHINRNSVTFEAANMPQQANPSDYAKTALTFNFVRFSGAVDTQGAPIFFAKNNYSVWTETSCQVIVACVHTHFTVTTTPITLFQNSIWYSNHQPTALKTYVVSAEQAITTMGHHLLKLWYNHIEYKIFNATRSTPIYSYIANFDSDLSYLPPTQYTDNDKWIELQHNTIIFDAQCSILFFYVVSFRGSVDLVQLNVSNTYLQTTIETSYSSDMNWVMLRNSITTSNAAPGDKVIELSGNEWIHKHFGRDHLGIEISRAALAYWLQFYTNSLNDVDVKLKTITFNSNKFYATMNASKAGGEAKAWWMAVQLKSQKEFYYFGNVSFTSNLADVYMLANTAEFLYLGTENFIDVQGNLVMTSNNNKFRCPNASATATLVSSSKSMTVDGLTEIISNFLEVLRPGCFNYDMTTCDNTKSTGRFLSATIMRLSGDSFLFNNKLVAIDNTIIVGSSAILIETPQIAAAQKLQGVHIIQVLAAKFTCTEYVLVHINKIAGGVETLQQWPAQQQINVMNRVPVSFVTINDATGTPGFSQTSNFEATSQRLVVHSGTIHFKCAPCTVSPLVVNVSSTGIVKMDEVSVRLVTLHADVPQNVDSQIFPTVENTNYFVFAAMAMFCLPQTDAFVFKCHNPITIRPDKTEDVEITIQNTTVRVEFPTSFGVTPSYHGYNSATFPQGFADTSFQVSMVLAQSGTSFKAQETSGDHTISLGFEFNNLQWNDVPANTTNFTKYLSDNYIVSAFSQGGSIFDMNSNLSYNQLYVAAGCGNSLGSPVATMMSLVGMGDVWTNVCGLPPPATTPAPGGHHHNGGNVPHHGGLSAGGEAAIIVVVLFAIILGALFIYIRWDRIKDYLNLNQGLTDGDLGERGPMSGYGAVNNGPGDDTASQLSMQEVEARRMSTSSFPRSAGEV